MKATPERAGEQTELLHKLVAEDPSKFFLPPYMAHHGYVGIYLDTAGLIAQLTVKS